MLALLPARYRRTVWALGILAFAAAGAWVAWQGLPTVLLIGAAVGLAHAGLLAAQGRFEPARQPIPFGIGLATGFWLVRLHGPLHFG